MYGFMLLVFIILAIVTVCVTIVGTYFLLNAENYHWQWTSFCAAASTSLCAPLAIDCSPVACFLCYCCFLHCGCSHTKHENASEMTMQRAAVYWRAEVACWAWTV